MDDDFLTNLLLMGGGGLIQHNAQQQALRRQMASIQAGQQEQNAFGQQRLAEIFGNAQQYAPAASAQALQSAADPIRQNLQGVAQQAAAASQAPVAPNMSADYTRASAGRNASELQRAMQGADLSAQAQAAGRVGMSQQMANNQSVSNQNNIGAMMAAAARNRGNDIDKAGRVNNGQMLLGAGISAIPALRLASGQGNDALRNSLF